MPNVPLWLLVPTFVVGFALGLIYTTLRVRQMTRYAQREDWWYR